jgi:hypothetical protein
MVRTNGQASSVERERHEALQLGDATITRSRVGSLEADTAQLERSAVRRLHAREATVERSFVGIARAENATLRQGNAGIVIGRSVACDEVRTFVLAAPVVRGEVHTWLDLRTAVAIGFGMALGKLVIAAVRDAGRRATG